MPRRPLRASMLAPLALTATAALATSCGSGSVPTKPGVVRVVAAENFWGDMVEQIGGKHVAVTSLISDPNTDPHLFESDPRTAGAIASAQLIIENGLGYDGFVEKTVEAVGDHGQRFLSVAGSLDVERVPDANPHLWYWTSQLPKVARAMAEQLSAVDAADASYFAARERRFVRTLDPLIRTIATIKRKYAGTPVGYTERLPGYLLDAAQLQVATPQSFAQALEDGNDPSPGDTATFEADIRDHKIKALIYNAQVIDAATGRLRKLAMSSGVPVVGMTETMPAGTSFQAWQLRQDRALLKALGG